MAGETLDTFRVILTGYASKKGEYYIEEAFAQAFSITHAEARQIFKSLPNTLREGLSLAEAEEFKAAVVAAGASCDIENMRFNISHLSLE